MAKTIDGGNTWPNINYPTNNSITGMYFIDNNIGYLTVNLHKGTIATTISNGNSLYRTLDGGNNWSLINENLYNDLNDILSNLFFRNELEGFAQGALGIYHTTNGGKTWQNESPTNNTILKLFFPNSTCCYTIDNKRNIYKRTFQ